MSGHSPLEYCVRVNGGLTMATSGAWLKKIMADQSPSSRGLCVDLAGVTEFDSSALALVSSVERLMSEKGCKVQWINVPASILGVAHIYGADTIFETGSGG